MHCRVNRKVGNPQISNHFSEDENEKNYLAPIRFVLYQRDLGSLDSLVIVDAGLPILVETVRIDWARRRVGYLLNYNRKQQIGANVLL